MTSTVVAGDLERLLEEEGRLERLLASAREEAAGLTARAHADAQARAARLDGEVAAAVADCRRKLEAARRDALDGIARDSARRLQPYAQAGAEEIALLAAAVTDALSGGPP